MTRKTRLLPILPLLLALTGCVEGIPQKLDSSAPETQVSSPDIAEITEEEPMETQPAPTEAPPSYRAAAQEGLTFAEDYDAVVALCEDAAAVFPQAVNGGDVDFSQYIENSALLTYMQYRAENHGSSYAAGAALYVTQVEITDEYALVEGRFGSQTSMEGTFHFLVTNENGECRISEWYWDAMDSPDAEHRGSFSVETHLGWWEDPANYEPLFEVLQITME